MKQPCSHGYRTRLCAASPQKFWYNMEGLLGFLLHVGYYNRCISDHPTLPNVWRYRVKCLFEKHFSYLLEFSLHLHSNRLIKKPVISLSNHFILAELNYWMTYLSVSISTWESALCALCLCTHVTCPEWSSTRLSRHFIECASLSFSYLCVWGLLHCKLNLPLGTK